ncbi:MAG TPA: twin-arginine translocase subunit TatB [Methylococcaceae bacterium]|nr:twin-arginine translocase subunit TatB [Methylococcaceae bacterium]
MFDIGFTELCMIGLVALLVIGPEKLPKVARVAGFWVGKAKNTVAKVKAEIKEELDTEELRQAVREQSGLEEIEQFKAEADELRQKINKPMPSIVQSPKRTKKL